MRQYAKFVEAAYVENGYTVDTFLINPWVNINSTILMRIQRVMLVYLIYPLFLLYKGRKYRCIHVTDHSIIGVTFFLNRFYADTLYISIHDDVWFRVLQSSGVIGRKILELCKKSHTLAARVYYLTFVAKMNIEATLKSTAKDAYVTLLPIRDLTVLNHAESLSKYEGITVLHVGSSSDYKNRKAIIRLANDLLKNVSNTKVRFVLAGDKIGPHELDGGVVPSNVITVESPSDGELASLYRAANIFMFTSLNEGFGWPPLEAQTFGLPVIASNIPLFHETLGSSAYFIKSDPNVEVADFLEILNEIHLRFNRDNGFSNLKRFQLNFFRDNFKISYIDH